MERRPIYPRAVGNTENVGRPARDKVEHVIAIINGINNTLELLKRRGEPILMAELYGLVDALRDSLDIVPRTVEMLRGEFKFSQMKVRDDPVKEHAPEMEERAEERERHEVS